MSSRKAFYILPNNSIGTFYVLQSYHCISRYQKPLFQSLTINNGKMVLTYSLKYDLAYVKGFSDISSKSIECPQKRWEITVISMECKVVHLPYKNIFYYPQSSAVVMKGLIIAKETTNISTVGIYHCQKQFQKPCHITDRALHSNS